MICLPIIWRYELWRWRLFSFGGYGLALAVALALAVFGAIECFSTPFLLTYKKMFF